MAQSPTTNRTPVTPFRSHQSSGSLFQSTSPGQKQAQSISPLHALALSHNRTQNRSHSADQSNPAQNEAVYASVQPSISLHSFEAHGSVPLSPRAQKPAKISVEDDPVLQRVRRGRNSLSHSIQHTFSNILHSHNGVRGASLAEGNSVVEFASIPEAISSDALDDEEDMNPYTIEFINKTMEETFREYYWDIYYVDIRNFWIVSTIVSSLFTILFASFAEQNNLLVAVINFLFFILPCVFSLKFGTNQKIGHTKCMILFSTIVLLCVIGPIILVSILLTGTLLNPESTAAFVVTMSGLLPNLRLPLKYVTIVNFAAYISFLAACLSVPNDAQSPRRVAMPLLILLTSICVNVRNGYLSEMHVRMGFMYSRRMTGENEALRKKIWSLERSGQPQNSAEHVDLVSPMETVIRILKEISRGPYAETIKAKIDNVIALISEYETLLHPNITSQLQNIDGIDDDMSNWLFYELASKEKKIIDNQKSFRRTKHSIASTNFSSISHSYKLSKGEESHVENYIMRNFPWGWDTHEIDKLSKGHALVYTAMYLLKMLGIVERLKVDEAKLRHFLKDIATGYSHEAKYHNELHATDVVLSFFSLISRGKISNFMSDFDIFTCVIAAAVHDYGHPGFNNAFQINTESEKAVIYNDRSVLESYHVSAAWQVMKQPQNCFLEAFDPARKKEFRATVIDLVLATDMAHHFEILSEFKAKMAGNTFDLSDVRNKMLLLKLAIKISDLSHAAKPVEVHEKWAMQVQEEFFNQGDKERSMGIPISPFMDRSNCFIPKSQVGFMNFVALPLYEAFNYNGEHLDLVNQVKSNTKHWERKAANEVTPIVEESFGSVRSMVPSLANVPEQKSPRNAYTKIERGEK